MTKTNKILVPVLMFTAVALFYLYEFFLRVSPAAMFGQLMADFNISATKLGVLTSAFFVTYAIFQFPAGALLDRYGPRKLISLAILVCAIGAYLVGVTQDFDNVILARLLIGTGSAFAFIGAMKVATLWFHEKHFPLLTGLILTLGSLGAMSSQAPISYALEYVNWRTILIFMGGFGLLLALFAFVIVRDRNPNQPETHLDHTEHEKMLPLFLSVVKNPQNWLVAIYGMLITAPVDAFAGLWGVPFLVQAHHIDEVTASAAVSMAFVGLAVGSPFFGWYSTKIQSRKKAMYLTSMGACLTLFVLILTPNLSLSVIYVLFFLFGALGTFVLSFAITREINSPILLGAAAGFINMFANIGSASFQPVIGKILDTLWEGQIVNGVHVYTYTAFRGGLLILPLSYLLCLVVFIPLINESYKEHD